MSTFGKALDCGLDILQALEQSDAPQSFADLGRLVEVSPASFARFLKILLQRGYVMQGDDKRYQLGWRCSQLGQKVLAEAPLRERASQHLHSLAEMTGESAESVCFSIGGFTFLERVQSERSVVLRAQPGTLLTYNDQTAIGRLALCLKLAPGIPACSQKQISHIRKTGFTWMLQNNDEVYRGTAAVYGAMGSCIGCICIGAPAFRVKAEQRKRFRELLNKRAEAISFNLGWDGARPSLQEESS